MDYKGYYLLRRVHNKTIKGFIGNYVEPWLPLPNLLRFLGYVSVIKDAINSPLDNHYDQTMQSKSVLDAASMKLLNPSEAVGHSNYLAFHPTLVRAWAKWFYTFTRIALLTNKEGEALSEYHCGRVLGFILDAPYKARAIACATDSTDAACIPTQCKHEFRTYEDFGRSQVCLLCRQSRKEWDTPSRPLHELLDWRPAYLRRK